MGEPGGSAATIVGRITAGGADTEYQQNDHLGPLVVGPDGNLWAEAGEGPSIYRITTSGVATRFSVPGSDNIVHLTAGPDGNLWFVKSHAPSSPPRRAWSSARR